MTEGFYKDFTSETETPQLFHCFSLYGGRENLRRDRTETNGIVLSLVFSLSLSLGGVSLCIVTLV